MVESVLLHVIWACVIVLVAYVTLWVLGNVGVAVPPMVAKIIWIIVALVILLLFVRLLLGPGVLALP